MLLQLRYSWMCPDPIKPLEPRDGCNRQVCLGKADLLCMQGRKVPTAAALRKPHTIPEQPSQEARP